MPGLHGAHSPSALSSFRSLYKSVRKRLWTSVDFPRPDSPAHRKVKAGLRPRPLKQSLASQWPQPPTWEPGPLTSYHECEIKALLHGLSVHLVGQCGEAHVLLVDILEAGAGQVRGLPRPLGQPDALSPTQQRTESSK